jgi:hypothetical protein
VFDYLRFFIGIAAWIFTWCIAFWRGRWPERTFASTTLIVAVLQILLQRAQHGHPRLDIAATGLDLATFAVLLFLGIKSGRIWAIVASAFELTSVLAHFSVFWNHGASRFAYVSVPVLAGYLVLFAFQLGLVENELRRRAERKVAAKFRDPTSP